MPFFNLFKNKKNTNLEEIGYIKNITDYKYSRDDEFEKELIGGRKFKTYKEMADNDATVYGILYVIKSLIVKAPYKIISSDDKQGIEDALFIESCFKDMNFTFSDFIDEILTMLEYGFSLFEIVYKIRLGKEQKDSRYRSNYNDGKIGWRKFATRTQESIFEWDIDKNGGINGVVQSVDSSNVYIPIDKLLLFRTSVRNNLPEGRSLLRGAYKSWWYKKHIEKFEAVGIERDLAGLPVARIPKSQFGTKEQQEFKNLVTNIKNDHQAGLVIPSDVKDGARLYDIELLTAAGSKSVDTDKIITRYDSRIAMSLSADFMLLGQGSSGSWALSSDKTELFQNSLNYITKKISEVINRYAIPRLFEVNGFVREQTPIIEFESVAKKDLAQLAQVITSLSQAGMLMFPSPSIEKQILALMGFEPEDKDK